MTEPIIQKKYSIKEIDSMRKALYTNFYKTKSHRGPMTAQGHAAYDQLENMKVEEKLRTYMMAGIDPQELIDECNM